MASKGHLRLVTWSPWRTDTFRRLSQRLPDALGDKSAKPLEALKLYTVADLVRHVPRRYFSRAEESDFRRLKVGDNVMLVGQVVAVSVFNMPDDPGFRGGRARLEATLVDGRGAQLTCTFFGQPRLIRFWRNHLHRGDHGIFAGKLGEFRQNLQLAHPDFVMLDRDGEVVGGTATNKLMASVFARSALVGLYPLTKKLRTWTVAECVNLALDLLSGIEDPLPEWVRREARVLDLESALRAVHRPSTRAEAERGMARLRFEEAFALQLTMACRRADAAAHTAIPRQPRNNGILAAFDTRLPFALTEGQQLVSAEILGELDSRRPMQRLLQGEVGSGKTVVALRAMLAVVDAGGQAALLAPTEVLAAQHRHTIAQLLGDLGDGGQLGAAEHATEVALLTGSLTAKQRRTALEAIASGRAGIVIGTHALLSAGVEFADLGLVVVDEQHRFGVEQRAALTAKAAARPHVLVMTATPIPRSVAMTVFGDLEVSTLRELPAGRGEVSTVVVDSVAHPGWVDRAWQRIAEEAAAGRQAYVVCPRISAQDADDTEDDRPPAAAVEVVFAELTAGPLADLRVGVLHGRLSGDAKETVMGAFAAGELDVLVATTVIEVGVDVPNATLMVICDADRFGISQLHQLRGRIGRGDQTGLCLLLTGLPAGTPARERLAAVAGTRDGFELAEVDLQQRREGDVLGASQSGVQTSLRLLRVVDDADLIARARTLAERCVAEDPDLTSAPGLIDLVTDTESESASDWLERT